MNPPLHRHIPVAAHIGVAAFAVSCLGLVYSACCQSGSGQSGAAHDAAEQRNGILPPLVDLGPGQTYNGQEGGLYPGGSNVRPAAHDAAGQKIARGIVPLDADGNPDPVNGKIVIMPVSVSNGYGAWHLGDAGDTSTTFMTRANANPAKNPKLFIAYGFEYQLPGGNGGTGDPGPNSIFYRSLDHALSEQGVTPRQVQIVWLSMPVSGTSWGLNLPPEARTFPADAQQSKHAWKEIVHAIHIRYPNVKIIYSSTKGAMYMSARTENPEFVGGPIEPWNHDAAWGVKWVIEDQINGAPDLNYDPARGPVNAPWLSWGPYFWSYPDGDAPTLRRIRLDPRRCGPGPLAPVAQRPHQVRHHAPSPDDDRSHRHAVVPETRRTGQPAAHDSEGSEHRCQYGERRDDGVECDGSG